MRKLVSLIKLIEYIRCEVDLISEQIVAEEPFDDHIPINQIKKILDEALVVLDGDLPKINASGKQRAKSLFHLVEGLAIGNQVEFFNFCEIRICYLFEYVSRFDGKLDWSVMVSIQNFDNFL